MSSAPIPIRQRFGTKKPLRDISSSYGRLARRRGARRCGLPIPFAHHLGYGEDHRQRQDAQVEPETSA